MAVRPGFGVRTGRIGRAGMYDPAGSGMWERPDGGFTPVVPAKAGTQRLPMSHRGAARSAARRGDLRIIGYAAARFVCVPGQERRSNPAST